MPIASSYPFLNILWDMLIFTALIMWIWIAIACFGILAIASRARLATLLAREFTPFMLLFVALAIASIAWSIDPSLSLKRLVRLVTFLVASFGFVLWAWQRDRFQAAVRPILTALLCASLVFGMVAPSLAILANSLSMPASTSSASSS